MKATFTFAFIFTHSLSSSRRLSENFRFVKDTQRLPEQDSQLRNSSYRVSHYQVVNLKLVFFTSPYCSSFFLSDPHKNATVTACKGAAEKFEQGTTTFRIRNYTPQTPPIIEITFCNSVISLHC